jgi:ATP-dependent Clp protease ATP-binding subunit ClpA
MFERFTKLARTVVVHAQEIARERRSPTIGSEHLLLALFAVPDGLAAAVLGRLQVDRADVEGDLVRGGSLEHPFDAAGLATLGIDLEEVRRQAEETFGPGALDRTRAARGRWRGGHIPFERDAKKALELALREAVRLGHGFIGTEHLLLGLLHDGRARDVLVARGVGLDGTRALVEELVRKRQAG